MDQWHLLEQDVVLERLGSRLDGLEEREAHERLQEYGPNQLEERRLRSPWSVLASQFTEVMVIVLLIAAVISFVVGETTDAIMIMVIQPILEKLINNVATARRKRIFSYWILLNSLFLKALCPLRLSPNHIGM